MGRLLIALIFCVLGILMQGLINLDLGQIIIILSVPAMLIFLLLNRSPSWLWFFFLLAGCLGGIEFLHGYFITPIAYYYYIAGWLGGLAGVVTAILAPLHGPIFLMTSWLVGESADYIGDFFSGLFFALTSLFVYSAPFSEPLWEKIKGWRTKIRNRKTGIEK